MLSDSSEMVHTGVGVAAREVAVFWCSAHWVSAHLILRNFE